MKCPKCKGELEEGSSKGELAMDGMEVWQTKASGKIHTAKFGAKPVITYRCKECGYLESYAK